MTCEFLFLPEHLLMNLGAQLTINPKGTASLIFGNKGHFGYDCDCHYPEKRNGPYILQEKKKLTRHIC